MKALYRVFLIGAVALVFEPPATQAQPAAATRILDLFGQLRAAAASPGARGTVSFRLTDGEINDYMRYSLRTTPRPGLDSVTVKVFRNNYVSTYAVVDFDAVEKWKPGAIPLLLRPVLSGKKSIWVDYRLQVNDARLTFSVEKAYYGKVRLPAFLVEEVIHIVAARQPEKYDTSKPVPLPLGLRRIWTADHAVSGVN